MPSRVTRATLDVLEALMAASGRWVPARAGDFLPGVGWPSASRHHWAARSGASSALQLAIQPGLAIAFARGALDRPQSAIPNPVICPIPTQPDHTATAAGIARTTSGHRRTVLA
jgi:hypothetical protein